MTSVQWDQRYGQPRRDAVPTTATTATTATTTTTTTTTRTDLDLVVEVVDVAQVLSEPADVVVLGAHLDLQRLHFEAQRCRFAFQILGGGHGGGGGGGGSSGGGGVGVAARRRRRRRRRLQFGDAVLDARVLLLVGLQLALPLLDVGRRLLQGAGQPRVVVLQRGQLHLPFLGIGRTATSDDNNNNNIRQKKSKKVPLFCAWI